MRAHSTILSVLLIAEHLAPSHGESCKGFTALEDDVAALRADPPQFIAKLGEPYPARQVLVNRKLRERFGASRCAGSGSGLWRMKVDINVTKGPYKKEHRVILEIPPTYPNERPTVRLGSKLVNSYFSAVEEAHSNVPNSEFLNAWRGEDGSLRGLLTLLHKTLTGPLSATSADWSAQARSFKEETSVVRKYRKKRTHKRLFTINGFDPKSFLEVQLQSAIANLTGVQDRKEALALLLDSGVVTEVVPQMVYSFPVFTMEFCEMLMQEIRGFYKTGLPARRPNSMNNYGIILNDIGLEPLMFALQDAVIQPLAAVLFPKEGSELESHHAFTIRYRGGEDTHLDVHTDDSDVTFNVNLFGEYSGCPLVFCGLVGAPDHRQFRVAYQHKLGHAVLHSGRHRHGAEDIQGGERMNLVVWSYSYNFRHSAASKKKHKKERAPPHPRCLSYTHDRDYARFKEYPPGKREMFFGRGWCPQRGKEYDGFVPERPDSGRGRYYDDDDEL